MGSKFARLGQLLEKLGGFVIVGIGCLMGIALTYYSAFYTELCPENEDGSQTIVDNALQNVIVLVIAVAFFLLLKMFLQSKKEWIPRIEKGVLAFVLLYSFAAGGVWILLSHVKPYADAYSVCLVADCMLRGEYPMLPPTYMSYNPQQYGLVFILQGMFACFGSWNYMPWQIMNLLLFPLMIFAGYRIMKLLSENSMAVIFYLLMTLGYLPFYFYLPYVYGDFPFAACGMIIMWQTIVFCKKGKHSAILWAGLAAALGCLVRKNTIVVIIAASLVIIVCSMRHAKWSMLSMIVAMVLMTWGADRGVALYYEHISGLEIHSGVPSICYIMMGLEDTEEGPGWFNGDHYRALIRTDYDSQAAAAYGKEQIKLRLQEFWQNKSYTIDFFRRKLLSQWNMPDCYGVHETAHFTCEKEELPDIVQKVYFGVLGDRLMNYMDRYQFVLYVGFAMAMLSMLLKKKREMEYYLFGAAIIGGLFFSILWEAMSRYVLAYEGYMIPLAAVGIWELLNLLELSLHRIRGTSPWKTGGE